MPPETGTMPPLFWIVFGLLAALLLGTKLAQLLLPEDHPLAQWLHKVEWSFSTGPGHGSPGGGDDGCGDCGDGGGD